MLTTRIGMLRFWIKNVENLSYGPSLVRLSPCCSWPKGAVTFDDFCELLDFEDMPDEILQKCSCPLVVAVSISEEGYWNLKCFWRFIRFCFSANTFCTDTWGLSIGDAFLFLHLSARNYERHQSVCWKITTNSLLLVLAQHLKYFKLLELHCFGGIWPCFQPGVFQVQLRRLKDFAEKLFPASLVFKTRRTCRRIGSFARSDQCTNVIRCGKLGKSKP